MPIGRYRNERELLALTTLARECNVNPLCARLTELFGFLSLELSIVIEEEQHKH